MDISSSRLKKIAIHHVGNKTREEGIDLSREETNFNEELEETLLRNYLKPFSKQNLVYDFFHESDLSLNVVANLSGRIFSQPDIFVRQTQNIVKHLYSTSNHPNISEGNVLFLFFSHVVYAKRNHDAIAIIKIEKKDNFLDIEKSKNSFNIEERSGISLSLIQKGALIISDNAGVFCIDNLGQKTKYWIESFLRVSPRQTSQSCAKACSSSIKGIISKIDDVSKEVELIDNINRKAEVSENLAFKEVRSILSNFVKEDIISNAISGIAISSGIDLSDESNFTSKDFVKQTKNITNKIRVANGASFIVTNPRFVVSNVKVETHKNGFQAIIDVNITKDR